MVWSVVVAALITGCTSAEESKEEPKRPPPNVQVAQAVQGALTIEQTYLGQVRSRAQASLSAGASGEIEEVTVREGDEVKKGQQLVVIDTEVVSAQIRGALATKSRLVEERAQVGRELARVEELGPDVLPQVQAERSRSSASALDAAIAAQEALIRGARAQRKQHLILAPFDGVITQRLRGPGDWVAPGATVLEMVDPADLEVFVPVGASLASQVKTGQEVRLKDGERSVGAVVKGVVPALEPVTRTLTLRVIPKEPSPWLLPGGVVDCTIALEYKGQGVTVPRDALVVGAASTKVMVVGKGGVIEAVRVEVDRGTNDHVLLLPQPELRPGVSVVTKGNERLRPGQPVQIVKEGT